MSRRADRVATASASGGWPWWLATATCFVSACLLHLQFSLWLLRQQATPWGQYAPADLVPAAAALGALLLAVVAIAQVRRSPRPWRLGAGWMLWALAVLAIDRFLTYSANEYFHYPQYALLAWLVARSLDPQRARWVPGRVLFWTTLLGAADELLQYLWITASYSHYFDFNDVLVNLVAAGAGVLLYYGSANTPAASAVRARPPRLEAMVAASVALGVAVALASGRLQLSPSGALPPGGLAQDAQGRRAVGLQRTAGQHGSWQSGPRHGTFYVLTPLEGLLGAALAGVLFAGLVGAGRAPQAPAGGAAAATISPSSAPKST